MYGNQIVSCSGLDCSVCSLLEAFQHAFNWLLGLSAVTAVFLVTLAGLLYIFSLGKHKSLLKAKRSAKYAVAGLVFVLTAFLAVNTLFFLFGAASADNWFQIDCREDFAKEKLTKISSPKERTADLKFTIAAASSIFPSVSDPGKITGLDVAGVNPNSLLSDVLSLKPGQRIRFVATDKSISENDLKNFISQEKGYFVAGSGDRAEDANLENIVSIVRGENSFMVVLEGENPRILGEFKDEDGEINSNNTRVLMGKVIGLLANKKKEGNNIYVLNDKNQENDVSFNREACEESGGTVTIFQSECAARKEVCGQSTILCSDKEDEIMGCQCPAGTCLKDQKCVKIENLGEYYDGTDQDNDGVADRIDQCPNTPAGETVNRSKTSSDYGCSCSQLKLNEMACPPSRCEGVYMVTYPPLGQDACQDGKRTKYACEPKKELNEQCQRSMNQPNPISQIQQPNLPSQPIPPSSTGSSSNRGGSGSSSSGSGDSSGGDSGGGQPGGGCDSCNRGGNTGTPNNTGDLSSTPTSTIKPLSMQEAFDGGNGSPKDPFLMSDKAIQEVFSYDENTGKLELDKNWEARLGVLGKDSYVKIPDKEKVIKNVDKKRKEKGQKELTDEQKEKLEKDKDAMKAPQGTKVVGKDGKEKTVDPKADKNDSSKTTDNTLDSEEQVLKARTAGDSNFEPRNTLEREAKRMGLVKADDGTFIKKTNDDFFDPKFMPGLKRLSDTLKDQGYRIALVSGFRPGAIVEGTNITSQHAYGNAADIYLTDLQGKKLPVNSQTTAIVKEAVKTVGIGTLRTPYDWGWHTSGNGR